MWEVISAGAVVINPDRTHTYLIYKIPREEWALPKGQVKEGESLTAAALREVREETGLTEIELLSDKPLYKSKYSFEYKGKKINKTVVFYPVIALKLKQIITPQMKEEELTGNWFPPKDAIEKIKSGNAKSAVPAVEKVQKYMIFYAN